MSEADGCPDELLMRLVRARDVDGVLAIVDLDRVAEAWCIATAERLTATSTDDRISNEWAEVFVRDCLPRAPHRHRDALLHLVAHAPSNDVLDCIGAGPFEDFLVSVPTEVQWMEARASEDPRFQRAFDNMHF